jgi:cytidine deaminase
VLLQNGTVITGSNQENIAYPSGLCAERVALFYAGANHVNEEIDTLVIVAKGDLVPVEQALSPCGACRQVMLESENRQKNPFRVILVNQDGSANVFSSARDLLPLAFGISNV